MRCLIGINRKRVIVVRQMNEQLLTQIVSLIDQEVKRKVNSKITKYIEKISVRHGIPLKLLLEDLISVRPDDENTSNADREICLGVSKNGKRCKRPGGKNGYCWWHSDQKKIEKLSVCQPVPQVKHTHTMPPLFLAGCPACESKRQPQNLLIDM